MIARAEQTLRFANGQPIESRGAWPHNLTTPTVLRLLPRDHHRAMTSYILILYNKQFFVKRCVVCFDIKF